MVNKQESLKKKLHLLFPQPYFHNFARQYGNAFTAAAAVPSVECASRKSHATVKMCICFCFFLMLCFFKQLCH